MSSVRYKLKWKSFSIGIFVGFTLILDKIHFERKKQRGPFRECLECALICCKQSTKSIFMYFLTYVICLKTWFIVGVNVKRILCIFQKDHLFFFPKWILYIWLRNPHFVFIVFELSKASQSQRRTIFIQALLYKW